MLLKGILRLIIKPLSPSFKKKTKNIEVKTSFAEVTWLRLAAAVDYMGPLILPATCLARLLSKA